jgi:hypothetical protein
MASLSFQLPLDLPVELPARTEIRTAIRGRRLLMFGYGAGVRLVEPHAYGVTAAGHELLSAWMRPGYSRTDPEGGWRMYRLDGMHHVQALPAEFAGPRDGYNPFGLPFAEMRSCLTPRELLR